MVYAVDTPRVPCPVKGCRHEAPADVGYCLCCIMALGDRAGRAYAQQRALDPSKDLAKGDSTLVGLTLESLAADHDRHTARRHVGCRLCAALL